MISIIIASINPQLLEEIESNIEETIGVPYEIIVHDNRKDPLGICEIYNRGARLAKYKILCYTHEDILFNTDNWGLKVIDTFECVPNLGVIGLVGGSYKSFLPSDWGTQHKEYNIKYANYIQRYKKGTKEPEHIIQNPKNEDYTKVLCVDGMWFCTLKDIVNKYPFDQKLLKSFHSYEIDFCLSLYSHYEIIVTYQILVTHFSEGNYDSKWLKESLKVHSKWESILPASCESLTKKQINLIEKRAFKALIPKLKAIGYKKKKLVKMLFYYFMKKRSYTFQNFLKLGFYIIK